MMTKAGLEERENPLTEAVSETNNGKEGTATMLYSRSGERQ